MGVVGKTGLSWNADAAVLLGASKPLFEKGRRTVLVGHSYGGVPACAAADRPGGGFSHLAAFPMPARGMSVLSVCGGGWLPWYEVVELEGGGVSRLQIPSPPYFKILHRFDLRVLVAILSPHQHCGFLGDVSNS